MEWSGSSLERDFLGRNPSDVRMTPRFVQKSLPGGMKTKAQAFSAHGVWEGLEISFQVRRGHLKASSKSGML